MRFAVQALGFAFTLLVDATTFLTLPWLGGRPLLFIALANCFALRADALAGGSWGFAGGLLLGLLFADQRVGAMAFAGLLAGAAPALLKRLLFTHRWTGQVALGAVAGGLYDAALLGLLTVRGDLDLPAVGLLPRILLDAGLTGLAMPFLLRGVGRVEREV